MSSNNLPTSSVQYDYVSSVTDYVIVFMTSLESIENCLLMLRMEGGVNLFRGFAEEMYRD